jgi:fused signal recognition particle receptor
MFNFFKKKPPAEAALPTVPTATATAATAAAPVTKPLPEPEPTVQAAAAAPRQAWLSKLKAGLRKTGSSIAAVFTGTQIDEALYEDLETALLMADTGTAATQFLLDDLKRRVKDTKTTDPQAVKALLIDALTDLLKPLEKELQIGLYKPTVIMVAGVNGAGKTTSIGKLTRHLATHGATVLLAAADTFRAAAREQLNVWADRNTVDIISQDGGDPAAVSFDAVTAGKARGKDVVLIDTAGRLPTQLHLMAELQKVKRIIAKADNVQNPSHQSNSVNPENSSEFRINSSPADVFNKELAINNLAPHEILLVIDGNTGQNALMQVKAFDEALGLTGLIVTKLDGTAKGGVLAAIALWGSLRAAGAVPVYFVGVGEKVEDLETFSAKEFAQALLS